MTPERNTYADVWEQLDGKWSERVRVTDAALMGDEEIVRRWAQIGEGYLSKCMTALSLFTDAKNTRPQLWVRDPVVGRETFPGIYRLVTNEVDVQKPGLKGIIQTLRKGWAESAIWGEARIDETRYARSNNATAGVSDSASDTNDREVTVKFSNCSPYKLDAIASELYVSSYASGFTVGTKTYAGAWHCLLVKTKREEDGSGTVYLRLATPTYTIAAYDMFGTERETYAYYVANVPKENAQIVLDGWKTAHPVGSSATVSYNNDQKLVDIILRRKSLDPKTHNVGKVGWDCRYYETQVIYLGAASAESYPLSDSPGSGISYSRSVRSNGDGTFDIVVTTKTIVARDITGLVVEQSGDKTTTQQQQLGLTTGAVASMEEEVGKIKTQRVEIRDDCSKDVTTSVEVGKEQTTTEITSTNNYTETKTEKTYQATALPAPVKEPGHIKRIRNEDSKYPGKYNTTESDREILPVPGAIEYDIADDDAEHSHVEEDIGIQNTAGNVVELSAANGETLQASVQYDKESDTLDIKKATVTGKEQISTTKEASPGADETITEKTYQAAQLPPPSSIDGEIRKVENRESKYPGKYVTTESVRVVKPLDATANGGSALVDEMVESHQNATTDMAAGAPGASGTIIDNESRKNEAGRYDNRTVTRTAKPFGPIIDLHGGPLVQETIRISRNQNAMPNPGAGPAGTTRDVSASVNEFAKIDSVQTDRVAIHLGPLTDEHGGPIVEESSEYNRNAVAFPNPGPSPQGQTVDVQGVVNEFGRIDYVKTTKTGKQAEVLDVQTGGDAFVTEAVDFHRNKTAIVVTPEDGKIKDVSININDFKLLDGAVRVTTAKANVTTEFTSHDDGYKRVVKKIVRNSDIIPTVAADDEGHDVDASKNRYGKYDYEETKVTATKFSFTITEPGDKPSFQKFVYGLDSSTQIQPEIDAFVAQAASYLDRQHSVSAAVDRDQHGFYILRLVANVRDRSGGSVQLKDYGIPINIPKCKKYSSVSTTKCFYLISSSETTIETFFGNYAGYLVDHGAGGSTGVIYLGRGKYKATAVVDGAMP